MDLHIRRKPGQENRLNWADKNSKYEYDVLDGGVVVHSGTMQDCEAFQAGAEGKRYDWQPSRVSWSDGQDYATQTRAKCSAS